MELTGFLVVFFFVWWVGVIFHLAYISMYVWQGKRGKRCLAEKKNGLEQCLRTVCLSHRSEVGD